MAGGVDRRYLNWRRTVHMDPMMPLVAGSVFAILLLGLILRRLHQPHVVVYLLAGVLLGRHATALITDEASVAALLQKRISNKP